MVEKDSWPEANPTSSSKASSATKEGRRSSRFDELIRAVKGSRAGSKVRQKVTFRQPKQAEEDYYKYGKERELGRLEGLRKWRSYAFPLTLIANIIYLLLYFFGIIPSYNLEFVLWGSLILWSVLEATSGRGTPLTFVIIAFLIFNYPILGDQIAIAKVKLQDIRTGGSNPIDKFIGKAYQTYDPLRGGTVEEEPRKGIRFLSFETRDAFNAKEEISVPAKVEIDGLDYSGVSEDEKVKVSFNCYELDDVGNRVENGEGKVYAENDPSRNYVEVYPREKKVFDVECIFPNGLPLRNAQGKLPVNLPLLGQNIELEQGIEARGGKFVDKKTVVMVAMYEGFVQDSRLVVYTTLDQNKPRDIIKVVSDKELDKDGYGISQCEYGCGGDYKFVLDTNAQPITEKKLANLFVRLGRDYGTGSLSNVRTVLVSLPDNFNVNSEQCDFQPGGNYLIAKEEKLSGINERLKVINQTKAEDTELVELKCKYTVNNIPDVQIPIKQYIKGRAIYDSGIKRSALIEVYQEIQPELAT